MEKKDGLRGMTTAGAAVVNPVKMTPQKVMTSPGAGVGGQDPDGGSGGGGGNPKKKERKKQRKSQSEFKSNKGASPPGPGSGGGGGGGGRVCDSRTENVGPGAATAPGAAKSENKEAGAGTVSVLQDKSNVELKPCCEKSEEGTTTTNTTTTTTTTATTTMTAVAVAEPGKSGKKDNRETTVSDTGDGDDGRKSQHRDKKGQQQQQAAARDGSSGGGGGVKPPAAGTATTTTTAKGQGGGGGGGGETKTKAQITAERRMKQEAQRAAKLERQQAKGAQASSTAVKKEPMRVPTHLRADDEAKQRKLAKKLDKQSLPQHGPKERHLQLFSHLFAHKSSSSLIETNIYRGCTVHSSIIRLGLLYSRGLICGSNARCIGLLRAFHQVIQEYTTPSEKVLSRDLELQVRMSINFLNTCRHLSVSMRNAIRALKRRISLISPDMEEQEAKKTLLDFIDRYIKEKLYLAAEAIFPKAEDKIEDDDVIIVYSGSSLVRDILIYAKERNKRFSVIVVDSRPRMEGKNMVKSLAKNGVECSYVLISTISYVMQKATKVFLGAHAALANGYIMSRAGTSLLCMMAQAYTVPVLVFCETQKFSERVQTDSFVSNELGDPDDLIHLDNQPDCLRDWRSHESLTLLNLVYDFTPPELVTVVITELGTIPCSSIPVVLRVQEI